MMGVLMKTIDIFLIWIGIVLIALEFYRLHLLFMLNQKQVELQGRLDRIKQKIKQQELKEIKRGKNA